jgi:hypothetical protein
MRIPDAGYRMPEKQIPRRFAPRDDNRVITSEARDLLLAPFVVSGIRQPASDIES